MKYLYIFFSIALVVTLTSCEDKEVESTVTKSSNDIVEITAEEEKIIMDLLEETSK